LELATDSQPGVILPPRGVFDHHKLGDAIGVWWVEARDVAKHPPMHREAPATKNYLPPNVNSAKVEKPWVILPTHKIMLRVLRSLS